MFGLFKRKSPIDRMKSEYEKLMKEAFDLSKIDRSASDRKYAEADKIMKEIEALTTASA